MCGRKTQKNVHHAGFPDIDEMEFAASFVPSAFGSGDIYNIFQF